MHSFNVDSGFAEDEINQLRILEKIINEENDDIIKKKSILYSFDFKERSTLSSLDEFIELPKKSDLHKTKKIKNPILEESNQKTLSMSKSTDNIMKYPLKINDHNIDNDCTKCYTNDSIVTLPMLPIRSSLQKHKTNPIDSNSNIKGLH